MPGMSNYLEAALLNEVLRNTNYTPPAKVYLALYTSDPTDADVGTEVNGNAYARQEITFGAPAQVDDKATCVNSADVVFPIATGAWGNITHVGVRDALTGGNLLVSGQLQYSKDIQLNDQFKILAGGLTINLT